MEPASIPVIRVNHTSEFTWKKPCKTQPFRGGAECLASGSSGGKEGLGWWEVVFAWCIFDRRNYAGKIYEDLFLTSMLSFLIKINMCKSEITSDTKSRHKINKNTFNMGNSGEKQP